MPLPTRAPPTTTCPPAGILRAVATGHVPEPLLGVYLDHVGACDDCCARIEREAARPHPRGSATGPIADGQALEQWLHRLKNEAIADPTADDPRIGRLIGAFRIVGSLGAGGSAMVYEAIDEDLGRPVVLKVLRSAHDDDPEQHRLVVAEARALAAVQHDSIMPVLQLLWHDGAPVLVFPRLPGETFAEALAGGGCSPRLALTVVRDIARALAHTHSLGIFHHDVKPSNVWLHRHPDGEISALLFDFGLTGTPAVAAGTPGYSDPGTSAGTAPEPRDLFSLGVVLHECLGRVPGLPAGCRDLVRRLTAAEPAARPGAAAVAVEVERFLSPRSRASWRWAAATLFATCLAAVVAITVLRPAGAVRTGADAAVSGPIQPDAVFPGSGLPVAVSRDAGVRCAVGAGPSLAIAPLAGGVGATIPLAFRPDRIAFNAEGTRLAASDATGHVAIIDVPSARITGTHHFAAGVTWLGWSGWRRDAVVIQSGGSVHGFFKTKAVAPDPGTMQEWVLEPLRNDVVTLDTLPGTEGIVSLGADQKITMWSVGGLSEDIVVGLHRIDPSSPPAMPLLGWKSRGVCYIVQGSRVIEFAPYHGMLRHKVPAAMDSLVWLTESQFAFTADGPGGTSRLALGDTSRTGWTREFELSGERVENLLPLDDGRIAVVTSTGGVRIYSVR